MGRCSRPTSGDSTFRLKSIIQCNNNNNNNTAKGVPRDVIHSLHTGVLYFQNFSQFHGTRLNVILFGSRREVQQHGTDINSAMCRSAVPNLSGSEESAENVDKILFTPLSNVRLFWHCLS